MAEHWLLPFLVNLIWMSSVFGACVWLVLKLGRIRAPVAQHALWRGALLGLWLSPALALVGEELGLPTLGTLVRIPDRSAPGPSAAPVETASEVEPVREWNRPVSSAPRGASGLPLGESRVRPASGADGFLPTRAPDWRDWTRTHGPGLLLGVWGLGLGAAGVRWGQYRWRLRKWRRTTEEVRDPALLSLVQQVHKRLGLRWPVTVRHAPELAMPVIFGAWRPCLLLPPDWTNGTDAAALESALLHELAHVVRGDLWVNAAMQAAQCVFWFHPLVYLIGWQLSRTAEEACDDWVVAATGHRGDYANLLVNLAEQRMVRSASLVAGLPFARAGSNLKRRVQMIMDEQRPLITGLSQRGKWGLGLVVLLAAAMAVSTRATGTSEGIEPPRYRELGSDGRDEKARIVTITTRVRGPLDGLPCDDPRAVRLGFGSLPVWSPDGRKLVYFREYPPGFYLKSPEQGEEEPGKAIPNTEDAVGWGMLAWSPEGKRLLAPLSSEVEKKENGTRRSQTRLYFVFVRPGPRPATGLPIINAIAKIEAGGNCGWSIPTPESGEESSPAPLIPGAGTGRRCGIGRGSGFSSSPRGNCLSWMWPAGSPRS